jgi:hypothetical protein
MILKFILFLIIINIYLYFIIKRKFLKKNEFKIINKKCKIKLKKIGNNKKVIEIHDFFKLINGVTEFFYLNKYNLKVPTESMYPGSRFNIHNKIENEILNFMLLINKKYFKFKGEIYEYSCVYSVPDFNENKFCLLNSIPHRDNDIYRQGLAITIYLCNENPNYGGTIIYDFKNNNDYETVNSILNDKKSKKKKFDINVTNKFFKIIHNAELKFNKAVIYPMFYWHNINILPKNFNHNKNRLTITAFLTFENYLENDKMFYENYKILESKYYL